jgi:hypothetical protein
MKKKTVNYYSLTRLIEYCNETFKGKKNGKPFNVSDVKGYISRGKMPKSLGGAKITLCTEGDLQGVFTSTKLYKLEN